MSDSRQAPPLAVEPHKLVAESASQISGVFCADSFVADRQRRRVAERPLGEASRYSPIGGRRPSVTTCLAPRERIRVDVVGDGRFRSVHRDTLDAVRRDLTDGAADGALVSAAVVRPTDIPKLAALVRGFPAAPIVGLVGEADEQRALSGALAFGAAGVRVLVDGREAAGWRELRAAFVPNRVCEAGRRSGLMEIVKELGEAPVGLIRFFDAVFDPDATSMRHLAERFGICPSTLGSRFYRAGLPSPKRYLVFGRLVRAAYLLESRGLSVSAVAERLDASSPQSFQRSVRTYMGITATQFRERYSGAAMLAHFCRTLVTPYAPKLRAFDPFINGGAQVAPRAPSAPTPGTRYAASTGCAILVEGRAD
jgi:AraC-like DNA-binding protein